VAVFMGLLLAWAGGPVSMGELCSPYPLGVLQHC